MGIKDFIRFKLKKGQFWPIFGQILFFINYFTKFLVLELAIPGFISNPNPRIERKSGFQYWGLGIS